MKPITKTLVSMYAAMHMLASGCATSTSRNVSHTPVTHAEITFVEQKPYTFEEISNAVEDDSKTVGYIGRFDEIKAKIKSDEGHRFLRRDKDYNPQQDIRTLHSDIMDSDLENKSDLARILETFSYHRNETIIEKKGLDIDLNWERPNECIGPLSLSVGGLSCIYIPIWDAKTGRRIFGETEDMGELVTDMALSYLVTAMITYLTCMILDVWETKKEHRKKYFIKPYEGVERQIK